MTQHSQPENKQSMSMSNQGQTEVTVNSKVTRSCEVLTTTFFMRDIWSRLLVNDLSKQHYICHSHTSHHDNTASLLPPQHDICRPDTHSVKKRLPLPKIILRRWNPAMSSHNFYTTTNSPAGSNDFFIALLFSCVHFSLLSASSIYGSW